MTQPLFFEPHITFEKLAAEIDLPEDPNAWPKEVLDELFKQVPYISDFRPHVVMQKVDAERGYGFGHIEISNESEAQTSTDPRLTEAAGVRAVRIPVVVRDGKLSPFDLLVTDSSRVLPLTEARLRQAIFRPQAFDVTSQTPGDHSLIGTLYPPYRQNYGFGGGGITSPAGGMGKTSSAFEEYLFTELEKLDAGFRKPSQKTAAKRSKIAFKKTASILADILPTINRTDLNTFWKGIDGNIELQAAMRKNAAAVNRPLRLLVNPEHVTAEKRASVIPHLVRPTVVQLIKQADGYSMKTANHDYWRIFRSTIDRGELVQRFGEKVAMFVDTHGAVTIADDCTAVTEEKVADLEPVTSFGLYSVRQDDGDEVVGFVIPNLLDTDGQALPLSLFTNGSQATVQSEIFGSPVGQSADLPNGPVGGFGSFYRVTEDGGVEATVPMHLDASHAMPDEPTVMVGETFDGRPVEVSVQPNIQELTPMEEGRLLVPESWQWIPLADSEEVALAGGEEASSMPAEGEGEPPEDLEEEAEKASSAHIEIRCGGDTFTLSGPALKKVAMADRCFVDLDQAMFLLAALGVEQGHGATKLAHALHGDRMELVKVARALVPAEEVEAESVKLAQKYLSQIPDLRQFLVKEAAVIPDPTAVDTVLSMGFINPENLMSFVSYLPSIEEAQAHLCELLLAARIGLKDIPAGALERAVRAVEEVIEGLKVIAFQG